MACKEETRTILHILLANNDSLVAVSLHAEPPLFPSPLGSASFVVQVFSPALTLAWSALSFHSPTVSLCSEGELQPAAGHLPGLQVAWEERRGGWCLMTSVFQQDTGLLTVIQVGTCIHY